MRALILLLSLFVFRVATAQPENTTMPGGVAFDGEPSLAVNPTNPKNIVVGWMSEVLSDIAIGIRTSSSTDGGHTWRASTVLPHFGKLWHSADVSIVFAKNGTAYLSYIDYREAPDSGGIFVTHSTDGGATWSAPTQAFEVSDVPGKAAMDRPWIAIDNSGTSTDGTLYITTKPAPWIVPTKNSPNEPYFKRSTDHGVTWSSIAALDADPYATGYLIAAPMAAPNVTAGGAFVAVYPSVQTLQPARHILARSGDQGRTFDRYVVAEKRKVNIVSDTLSKLGYCLVTDPVDSNRMALILPSDSLGDWDAFAISSIDGGRTWGTPRRINDDAPGNGVWQDLVWGAYAPNGDLVASWRDRRNGSGTGYRVANDVYFAVSTDNGLTFGKNLRLSSTTAEYDSVLDLNGNDFLSCAVAEDSICTAWGDTRTGKLKVYFAKAALSDGIASVTEITKSEPEFTTWPTIVRDYFTCELSYHIDGSVSMELTDIGGRIYSFNSTVLSDHAVRIELPENTPSGTYLFTLECGSHGYTSKIIVAK